VGPYDETARFFKALSHPLRLQIIEVLERDGESCVCHLECRLGERQPQISQQLTRLKGAGLVRGRRDGLNIFYSLTSPDIVALVRAANGAVLGSVGRQGRGEGPRLARTGAPRACPCPRCRAATAPSSPSLREEVGA
jgi:ArsR family transcriptional regulator